MTARELAFRSLIRWTVLSDPPFLPERTDPQWAPLPSRDRAFAFDLLTTVIRRRTTLDAVIASRLRQPVDSLDLPIRAILWIGAAQLLFHAHTAAYAAVDTAVELARKLPNTARAAGLVNAVLRGITRMHPQVEPLANHPRSRRAFPLDADTAVTLSVDIFPHPFAATDAWLAATLSHPVALVQRLRGLFGDAQAARLMIRNNTRPVVTLRADDPAFTPPADAALVPHATAAQFFVAHEGWSDALERMIAAGALSPQDPTAALPVRAAADLAGNPPARVLDLCAGLGTKSLQLARAFPEARVTATDIDAEKLSRLGARGVGVSQSNLITRSLLDLADEQFDLVLVDVPCSNMGVMSKRVQSRWRWPILDRPALRALQADLLRQGGARVAGKGVLIYSTCSLDPDENEAIVRGFLAEFPAFQMEREQTTLPALVADPARTQDGGYFAILRRSAP